MAKMKNGTINVPIEQEEILWTDRKRKTIFALPWSFHKYTLTKSRILVQNGFFTRTEDEIKLYRISDISYTETLWERMANCGTICLLSSDVSMPELHLTHIKRAKVVKDVISKCVEEARLANGVRTSEIVGTHGGPEGPHHDDPHHNGHHDIPDHDPAHPHLDPHADDVPHPIDDAAHHI